MFWQVMIVVERPVAQVLQWSGWRRWHQARARYHHYRRRLEPLLPPVKRTGRPWTHDRRIVLEAIVYVLQTDCGWHHLPARFPPWQTVYAQFTQWRTTGIWAKIWNADGAGHTEQQLQL